MMKDCFPRLHKLISFNSDPLDVRTKFEIMAIHIEIEKTKNPSGEDRSFGVDRGGVEPQRQD